MKKTFSKSFAKLGVVSGAIALGATSASAAITLPTALDVAGVESIAGLMIGALALIWVARKVVSFLR